MNKVVAIAALLLVGANAQVRVLNNGLGLNGISLGGLRTTGLGGLNYGGDGVIIGDNSYSRLNIGVTQPQVIGLAAPQAQYIAAPAPRIIAAQQQPLIRNVAFNNELNYAPQPYSFEYGTDDEQGTTTSRRESSDGRTVTGSYGYTDADGVGRIVDYVADENGYRANIRTNEPGVGRNQEIGDPADTTWDIQPTPPGVVERYTNYNLNAQPLIRNVQPRVQAIAVPQPALRTIQPQITVAQPAVRTVVVGGGNANLGLINRGAALNYGGLRAFSGGPVNGGLINTGLLNGGLINRGLALRQQPAARTVVVGNNGGYDGYNGGGYYGGGLAVNDGYYGGGLGAITTSTGIIAQPGNYGYRKA